MFPQVRCLEHHHLYCSLFESEILSAIMHLMGSRNLGEGVRPVPAAQVRATCWARAVLQLGISKVKIAELKAIDG
jgi:hypothetical protein